MKKQLLFLLGLLIILPTAARDFTYTYEGQTVTYTVLDEEAKTVKIKESNKVSGTLILPSHPKDGNTEYILTEIGNRAFGYCDGLTSVTIPNSVKTIGEYAFDFCRDLAFVTIPASVTSIGEGAFSECTGLIKADFASIESLCNINFETNDANPLRWDERLYINGEEVTEVIVPDGIEALNGTFAGGCRLTSVTIPNTVKIIGNSAFYGCIGLTSIEIPNSVTEIGGDVFSLCSGLKSITIPTSVTSIGWYAFSLCSGLTSVTIPNSVTEIGQGAFHTCSSLTSLTISNSVKTIGDEAFGECNSLTSVYYGTDEPISADQYVFDKSTYQKATLYMTEKGTQKALMVNPWRHFENIEKYDFSGIEDISADLDVDTPYDVYNLSGVKVGNSTDNLAPGFYIVRQGGKAKKIMEN